MKALFVLGTRPEAIKMAPVIREFRLRSGISTSVCVTGQHRGMLDQVLQFFSIVPDYDLDLMKPNQNLFDITTGTLTGMEKVLQKALPDCLLVQGDTTTAFAGALSAFYKRIPIAHIEAGLRSNNLFSPYPEEANRIMVGHLAQFHFTPTEKCAKNLVTEGIHEHVYTVGNSVIDALYQGLEIIKNQPENTYRQFFNPIKLDRRIVLITGHRRESFGQPFEAICTAIRQLAGEFEDVEFVYPVHFNPNVREVVNRLLSGITNVHLLEPLDYPRLIWLMNHSYLVLTDSGGIQEEAPALGKPVLVMRDVTEREEGVTAGTARLVGTRQSVIMDSVRELLLDNSQYKKMAQAVNPYGDGQTSKRIADILMKQFA